MADQRKKTSKGIPISISRHPDYMIIIGNDNSNLFNNENDDDDYGYHYYYSDSCVTIIWRSLFSQHISKTALTRFWASSSGTAAVGRLGYELSCHKIGKNWWNQWFMVDIPLTIGTLKSKLLQNRDILLRSYGWSQCCFVKLLLYQDHLFLWGLRTRRWIWIWFRVVSGSSDLVLGAASQVRHEVIAVIRGSPGL